MKLPKPILLSIVGATALTAACGETPAEQQADTMDDQIEMEADRSAVAAGTDEAALGMTEAQLLDADLVNADGTDLGDVALVRRDDNGTVTGLEIELEDTDPDRWVEIPMDGLTLRGNATDGDVQTSMTAADLAALPDADMSAVNNTTM